MNNLITRIVVSCLVISAVTTQAQRPSATHSGQAGHVAGTPVGPPTKPNDISYSGELFGLDREKGPREIDVCNMDGRGNWKYLVTARTVVGNGVYWLTTETRVLNSGVPGDLGPVRVGSRVIGAYKEFRSLPDRKPIFISMMSSFTPKVSAPVAGAAPVPNKDTAAKNRAEADARTLKHHQELADDGEARGQYEMGLHYLNGTGVPVDAARARDYFTKAAAQGHKEAAAELAKLNAAH